MVGEMDLVGVIRLCVLVVIGPMLGFFPIVYVKQNSYITCMDEKPSMKLTRCCILISEDWSKMILGNSSDLQVFLLGRSTFPRHGVEGSYSSKGPSSTEMQYFHCSCGR